MEAWRDLVLETAGGRSWLSSGSEVGRAGRGSEDDWNARFQACREMEGKASAFALTELNRDFVFVASTVARTIVLERYVPNERKTVRAMDAALGGIGRGAGTRRVFEGWLSVLSDGTARSRVRRFMWQTSRTREER